MLPLIVIAFWSKVWIGWWFLIPVIVSLSWMLFNPVVFRKTRSTKSWASKAVLGERVWANRDKVDVPGYHKTVPNILNGISSAGMVFSIWAIVTLSTWPAILGISLAYLGKSWYLDRMVWIYEDMKHLPEYGEWDY